jgi:hypothetical protein
MSFKQFGIDVSRWQGNFNFARAKAEGVEFAIIKAGGGDDGLYKDSKYEDYYNLAKAQGLNVGAYYFGKAKTVERAAQEAEHFISLLAGHQFEYPVYYDVEGDMLNVGKDLLTEIIITFCDKVEKAGYYSGFYTGEWAVNNNMDDKRLVHFTHWIARWAKTKPKCKSGAVVGVWQFGGSTNLIRDNKIAGVVCDQDYCYQDFPSAIKKLGLNGFPKGDEPTKQYVTVTASSLNCREYPSLDAKIIGAFYKDTRLELLERGPEWDKVKGINGDHEVIGYCYAKYLKG